MYREVPADPTDPTVSSAASAPSAVPGRPQGGAPPGPGAGPGAGRSRRKRAPLPRILVVEDDFLVSAELEAALAEAGYDVVGTARTADEAVAITRDEKPALVIMDIRLAGARDGIAAALEIFDKTGIRCIFATAHHDPATRLRAAPAAPLGWLAKPFASATLIAQVEAALRTLGSS